MGARWAIIPARLGSSRLPGKPLADVAGQTLIARVCAGVRASALFDRIVVATDAQAIADEATRLNIEAVLTGECRTGTERVAEACRQLHVPQNDVVVNVQGDEPFVATGQLQAVLVLLEAGADVATLCKRIESGQVLEASTVKLVRALDGKALYFSRSVVPFVREAALATPYYKHIGLYGYRMGMLQRLAALSPTPLELAESLEQLRWLENGIAIATAETLDEALSVDTPADLAAAIAFARAHGL